MVSAQKMVRSILHWFKSMQVNTLKPFGKELAPDVPRISICDTNREIATVFARVFAGEANVEVCHGNVLHLAAGALVSPANSFGDMSGGVDKAIDDFFGGQAQTRVQAYIREAFLGEMPVGVAAILPMPPGQFPFLIVAPTMRIPGYAGKTINAYLAMRAILVAIIRHNQTDARPIHHIAVPSLCTGVGGMPYGEAAGQMHAAVENVLKGRYQSIVHPATAPYATGAKWTWSQKSNG
jgi:O-acetyl-ADP-ribose deacetylase (regulator of RNase III)